MAALTPLRKLVLVAVSTAAALLGAGSAFAASSSAPLSDDPSGARVQRYSSLRSAVSANQDRFSAYYYYMLER